MSASAVITAGKAQLAVCDHGSGEPVLLLPPTATRADIWTLFSATTLADNGQVADLLALVQSSYARGVRAAMQYEATIIGDRTDALRQVCRPCLVVAFAEDSLTPPAGCREVARAIPGCRHVRLADCGHFGFLERPEQVNAILMDFFAAAR